MQIAAGFFDESTDDETNGQCYCVAGFAGAQWATAALEMEWRTRIDKWGIEYFKASELNAGEGEFKKFRDDPEAKEWRPFSKREKELFDQIKTEFTEVIANSRDLNGIGVALVLPDYYRLKEESPLARKYLLTPYHLCAQTILMQVGMSIYEENEGYRSNDRVRIKPIFDSHEQYSGRMKQAFDTFAVKNPKSSKYMLPPDYEDDRMYLTLQAADNLAYEARRYLLHRVFANPPQPRRSILPILQSPRNGIRLFKLAYRFLKLLSESQPEDTLLEPSTVADFGSITEEADEKE